MEHLRTGDIPALLFRIILGTACMAFAVNMVYIPAGMVTGGISGLSILLNRIAEERFFLSVPVWLINFVLNMPVFFMAFKVKGKAYTVWSLVANLCFTAALYLIPVYDLTGGDLFATAVLGGTASGLGLGLVLSYGISTGGTDLLSVLLHHFMPYEPVGQLLFLMDGLIILAGAWQFGFRVAIYAVAAVFVASRLMDMMIEGSKFAKLAYIISREYQQIGQELMDKLGRGVTVLPGVGMYTGGSKNILMCVVGKKQIQAVCRIARKYDKKSFVIISDIREVWGEGFVKKPQI